MTPTFKITIAALVAVGAFFYFMLPDRKDMVRVSTLDNAGSAANHIAGKLVTEGKSGEVYLWVEQSGKIMCPKKTFVETNVEQDFSYTCHAMTTNDRFTVFTDRNPSDWVKKYATSL